MTSSAYSPQVSALAPSVLSGQPTSSWQGQSSAGEAVTYHTTSAVPSGTQSTYPTRVTAVTSGNDMGGISEPFIRQKQTEVVTHQQPVSSTYQGYYPTSAVSSPLAPSKVAGYSTPTTTNYTTTAAYSGPVTSHSSPSPVTYVSSKATPGYIQYAGSPETTTVTKVSGQQSESNMHGATTTYYTGPTKHTVTETVTKYEGSASPMAPQYYRPTEGTYAPSNVPPVRVVEERRYKKKRAIVKRQPAGCCGGCNACCCGGGLCDKPSGKCRCWNIQGCCDREKTIVRRVSCTLSDDDVAIMAQQPQRKKKGCC